MSAATYGQALATALGALPSQWDPRPERTVTVEVTFKDPGITAETHPITGDAAFAMDVLDRLLIDPRVQGVAITFGEGS